MDKCCSNCRHGQEAFFNSWGCENERSTIGIMTKSKAEHFFCCYWQEREPESAEYRPGDGPFWAKRTESSWGIFCGTNEAYHRLYAITPGLLGGGGAGVRVEVDSLNAACREWTEKRPPLLCHADMRNRFIDSLLEEVMEWRTAFAVYGKTAEEASYNIRSIINDMGKGLAFFAIWHDARKEKPDTDRLVVVVCVDTPNFALARYPRQDKDNQRGWEVYPPYGGTEYTTHSSVRYWAELPKMPEKP